jgi:hypothetical protein
VFRHDLSFLQLQVIFQLTGSTSLHQRHLLLLLVVLVVLVQLQLCGFQGRQLQGTRSNRASQLQLLLLLPRLLLHSVAGRDPGQPSSSSSTCWGFIWLLLHCKHDPISAADAHRAAPDVLQLTRVCLQHASPSTSSCRVPAKIAGAVDRLAPVG